MTRTTRPPIMTTRTITAAAVTAVFIAFGPLSQGTVHAQTPCVSLDAEAGFQSDASTVTWTDLSDQQGLSAFEAQYSARPERVEAATPNGKPALRFNGAANNPNRLTCKADSSLTTAEGASLSWVLVLKPGSLSGTNDTYLQTTLDGRNYAWGVYRDAKGFHAEVRATAGARHISTLPIDALADHATGWMVLTAVYDAAAQTLQLFLTDAAGQTHAGGIATGASLHPGEHKLTAMGTNTDRNNGAAMDLAAVRVFPAALDESLREPLAQELLAHHIATSE